MIKSIFLFLTLTSVLTFSLISQSAELFQQGQPTRCLAMGGTCVSHVRGVQSLYFNPAALARVEGFALTLARVDVGTSKDTVDFSSNFQGSSFTASDVNQLYGKTLQADVNARGGFVAPHFGFGVFSNNYTSMRFSDPTFPTFDMNFISDYGYIIGGALSLGANTSVGLSARHIKRWGGAESIAVSSIIGASSSDLANNNFQNRGVGHGLDVALMTTLDGDWKPTLSLVWKDIGVTSFSQTTGTAPPPAQYDNLIFGASAHQSLGLLDLTHAFEYKYIRTTGYDLSQKIHLGTEASLGPLDLRAGFSQGYLSYGVGLDLWLFQLDAAAYTTEMGTYAGQSRNDKYNISLTIELDFDQSFKLQNSEGKKRRLKQRR